MYDYAYVLMWLIMLFIGLKWVLRPRSIFISSIEKLGETDKSLFFGRPHEWDKSALKKARFYRKHPKTILLTIRIIGALLVSLTLFMLWIKFHGTVSEINIVS